MPPILAEGTKDVADVWQVACYGLSATVVALAAAYLKSVAQNRADLREMIPLTTRFLAAIEREEKT